MFFAVFPLLSRALMCCSRQPQSEWQRAGDKGQGWQGTRQGQKQAANCLRLPCTEPWKEKVLKNPARTRNEIEL